MDNGFIKLHRKIVDWEWYTDVPVRVLFEHLLLKANFKETNWRGEVVKPGQVFTGRKQLAMETGLSEQQVRTALEKLESTGEATSKTTNRYSVIDLKNWNKYNDSNQQITITATNNQPTDNQQITTSNNVKKEKKEIINNIVEFLNSTASKNFKSNSTSTIKHINARLREGYTLEDFKRVIEIKTSEWLGRENEKYLRPSTLFGTKFESYLNQGEKTDEEYLREFDALGFSQFRAKYRNLLGHEKGSEFALKINNKYSS